MMLLKVLLSTAACISFAVTLTAQQEQEIPKQAIIPGQKVSRKNVRDQITQIDAQLKQLQANGKDLQKRLDFSKSEANRLLFIDFFAARNYTERVQVLQAEITANQNRMATLEAQRRQLQRQL